MCKTALEVLSNVITAYSRTLQKRRKKSKYDMSIVMLLILEPARSRVKVYVNNDPRLI